MTREELIELLVEAKLKPQNFTRKDKSRTASSAHGTYDLTPRQYQAMKRGHFRAAENKNWRKSSAGKKWRRVNAPSALDRDTSGDP